MWVRTQGHKLINLDNTSVLFVNSAGQTVNNSDERVYEVNTGIPNSKSGSLAAGTRIYCEAIVDALTDAIANHDHIVDLRRLTFGAGYESVELRHGRWEPNTSNDDALLPSAG
jgi:hypothetical protein